MADKDKKPEKIDMSDVLGSEGSASGDSGEIELLDPGTGAPMRGASRAATGEGTSADASAALAEREKYYDLWIRSRADLENFRKRVERERDEERAQAGASLVRDILPVLDNLERALSGGAAGDPFHDGIALICRQLRDCLARAGLEPIDALGAVFDPVYHEAVLTAQTDQFEPNTVLEEIQKGYLFRGRVLRPALVKVAVRPGQSPGQQGAASEAPGGGTHER